jgi:hypothetical protein
MNSGILVGAVKCAQASLKSALIVGGSIMLSNREYGDVTCFLPVRTVERGSSNYYMRAIRESVVTGPTLYQYCRERL